MVTFGYTIIYVKNVENELSFFEKAFGLRRKFITEEGDYGELITGETTLSFASDELGKSNIPDNLITANTKEKPPSYEIALVSEDVESTFKKALENEAIEVLSPVEKPWGQTVAYVRSHSGILIEICTPIKS